MVRLREIRTVGAVAWVVVLSLVCQAALGREAKLVIRPQKVSAEAGKCLLLAPPASLTDGDAAPLYDKAVKALSADIDLDQIVEWWAMPLEQLPLQEVKKVLDQHRESLKGAAQAARCRECKWPRLTIGEAAADAAEYKRFGCVVRLWTRYEIARGNYEAAIHAMQTGFGMGRYLTQAPTLVQFIAGVSIVSMMGGEVEAFAQADGAPSLHSALVALPAPLADVEKAIENDKKTASSEWSGMLAGEQIEQIFESAAMRASYNGVRLLAKRLDRDLAALQCIEALRSYAASHGGQLPQTLAEITEVAVPKDPTNGEAFRYTRTGATAVLESTVPAGGEKKDGLRYEISVRN